MPEDTTSTPKLTPRFDEALGFASELHRTQLRKGTQIPYVAHLLGVTALVLEAGGDEDEAIGALLHDAVEDQGGRPTLERIRERFGSRVAAIVEGCTDTDVQPKPPWRERKEAYIAHLPAATPSVWRVSCADKLHNCRAIIRDRRQVGDAIWERFNGAKPGILWYYRALADTFDRILKDSLSDELRRCVEELERLA